METSINDHQKTLSAIIHLSTFSKYLIPFGNFIFPLLLWTSNKNDSEFIDHHGRQALNFQISILLYSITLGIAVVTLVLFSLWDFVGFIDILEHNTHHIDFHLRDALKLGGNIFFISVAAILAIGLLITDIFCTITATIKAKEGIEYRYPLTINFI